jgi:hypothetical protein
VPVQRSCRGAAAEPAPDEIRGDSAKQYAWLPFGLAEPGRKRPCEARRSLRCGQTPTVSGNSRFTNRLDFGECRDCHITIFLGLEPKHGPPFRRAWLFLELAVLPERLTKRAQPAATSGAAQRGRSQDRGESAGLRQDALTPFARAPDGINNPATSPPAAVHESPRIRRPPRRPFTMRAAGLLMSYSDCGVFCPGEPFRASVGFYACLMASSPATMAAGAAGTRRCR